MYSCDHHRSCAPRGVACCCGAEGRPGPQRPRWPPGAQQGLGTCYPERRLLRKPRPSSLISRRFLGTQELSRQILAPSDILHPNPAPKGLRGLVALCLPSPTQRDRTISPTFPPRKFTSLTFHPTPRPEIQTFTWSQECYVQDPPPCRVRRGPALPPPSAKVLGLPQPFLPSASPQPFPNGARASYLQFPPTQESPPISTHRSLPIRLS